MRAASTAARPPAQRESQDRSSWGGIWSKMDPCQGLVVGKPDTGRRRSEFSVGGSFLDLYILHRKV